MNNIQNLWFRLELDKIYPEILDDNSREAIIYQEYISKLELFNHLNTNIEINDLSIIKYKIELIRKQLKERSHSNEFKNSLQQLINDFKLKIITNRLKHN